MSADLHLLTNLVTLSASNAGLTGTLDLHGITTLTDVDCSFNLSLQHVDIHDCTSLNNFSTNLNGGMLTIDGSGIITSPGVWDLDGNTAVTSCDFSDLISGPINFHIPAKADLSSLTTAGDLIWVSPPSNTAITLASFDASGTYTGQIICSFTTKITSISLPVATSSAMSLEILNNADLLTISMPGVVGIDQMQISANPNLASVTFTNLSSINSFFGISNNVNLSTLSLPSLVSLGGGADFSGCSALATFSCPNWIMTDGLDYVFQGDALSSASIDNILSRGVASGLTGGSIDLSGGTNLSHASWSAGALANETTLTTAGVTVLSNP